MKNLFNAVAHGPRKSAGALCVDVASPRTGKHSLPAMGHCDVWLCGFEEAWHRHGPAEKEHPRVAASENWPGYDRRYSDADACPCGLRQRRSRRGSRPGLANKGGNRAATRMWQSRLGACCA